MGVRDIIPANPEIRYIIEKMVTSGCVTFHLGPDQRTWFDLNYARIPTDLRYFIDEVAAIGPSAVLESVIQGHAYNEGLKIVTLDQLDAEALENTALNFPISDYAQPFPTLFVDLPLAFFESHEVECPQGGEFYAGVQTPGRHYPHTVGIRRYKEDVLNYIIATVYFTSGQAFTALLCGQTDGTLEDAITDAFTPGRQMANSEFISPQEDTVVLAALRLALNTVLVLESEGMRKLGPRDVKYYNRLEENVRKAHKRRDPKEKIQRAEQTLRVEPIYYTFDQGVVIYNREDASANGDTPHEFTGRVLKPHWRMCRGYHKIQHFGIGNTQRKRIRIPPVLVNKHRFVGHTRDTTATYEVRK